jgi:pimeloyl-ACP methyl ester carboxylesterase
MGRRGCVAPHAPADGEYDQMSSDRDRAPVTLAYSTSGAGDPVCVLLHGITLDRHDLRPLADPLAQTHTVVSLDLRGHGESPGGSGLEIEDLATDVCALADDLDLSSAVLIGHSLGGNVALAAAARAPARFGGLVILDSTPMPTPEALAWLEGLVDSIHGPDYATVWPEFCRTALFGWTADDQLRTSLSSHMGSAPPELTRPIVRSFTDYAAHRGRTDLAACDMAVLIVSSSSPTNDADAVREAAPQTVFAQVAGSGHFMHHEVPDQLYAMVEHFVTSCASRQEFARAAR